MSDINELVRRLRNVDLLDDYARAEAADLIERLRDALRGMVAWHTTGPAPPDQIKAITSARAALGE